MRCCSHINPDYGYLNSQAADSAAFAANIPNPGLVGVSDIGVGAETYDELCDVTLEVATDEPTIKKEIPGEISVLLRYTY